ncbi:hypothetical protein WME97_35235 [Sorangium sp. So ce367]|uniref:hypothetical protein n=1 Tax=Sorangium sp. So ce367 TaxID=3133305 RepID=UPI003F5E778E
MSNRFSSRASRPLRAANLLILASLAATSLVVGGCSTDLQIGDESGEGGGPDTATSTGGAPESTTSGAPESTTVGGTGGAPESTTVAGTGGAPGALAEPAFALFNEQITTLTPAQKQNWLEPGEVLEPKTLIIAVVYEGMWTCSDPVFVGGLGGPSRNQTLIGLPPSLQKVGKYDFSSTDVIAFHTEWVDAMGNGGGRESPLTEGTIEVLSIDDTAITVRLEDSRPDHVVPRCP